MQRQMSFCNRQSNFRSTTRNRRHNSPPTPRQHQTTHLQQGIIHRDHRDLLQATTRSSPRLTTINVQRFQQHKTSFLRTTHQTTFNHQLHKTSQLNYNRRGMTIQDPYTIRRTPYVVHHTLYIYNRALYSRGPTTVHRVPTLGWGTSHQKVLFYYQFHVIKTSTCYSIYTLLQPPKQGSTTHR